MKTWLRESRFGKWLLDQALANHLASQCRCHFGPARVSFAGWLYFRVLCSIARCDGNEQSHGIAGWGI